MKISYNWLRTYLNLEISPEEIAETLTGLGLEVEGHAPFETIKGGLQGLVVGEVITCTRHPQADKLSLTTVSIGAGELLPIVCGAPNVAAGQKVVVAPVGTTLYGFPEPLTLKAAKIRGEVSQGMLCAEDEIGMGKDHSGILVLDPGIPVGTLLKDLYMVESDHVFEIGLTPNRIDSASHFGVARELKAAMDREKSLKLTKPEAILPEKGDTLDIIVSIGTPEACLRYSGLTMTGITVADSPQWLKNRLLAIGMTPINNVVDITNFVLHETGQPLHAFDAQHINGNQIVVKTQPEGTAFTTLDGIERKLSAEDLMICNEREGMCMGGVFGGLQSGITAGTTSLFLESACFNPVSIRKTSKRHQIFTDSSFRFERGTDPNGTIYALKRAAALICEITGGRVASEVIDIYPDPVAPYTVELKWKNLDRLIGLVIDRDEVRHILSSLDIEILRETESALYLAVATYRVDVKREADVIEEILRIYGYNNVGIGEQVTSTLAYAVHPDPDQLENIISEQLVAQGFTEIMSNSLTQSAYYENLAAFNPSSEVKLLNPLSSDLASLRRTLLFGGLESISANISFRNQDLALFEFGHTYELKAGGNRLIADGYHETRKLGIWITGKKSPESWSLKPEATTFYELKSIFSLILMRLGADKHELTYQEDADERFITGLTCLTGEKKILVAGQVHPTLTERFEIGQPVFYAEINWDELLRKTRMNVRFQELPKYPWVRRDLALVVDQSVKYEEIRSLAFMVERKLLKEVNLFDLYVHEKLGQGKKSLAVSFILLDESKTLTDKQIDHVMSGLISAFEKKLGAALR
jgi:phenylalanyl-tRNA synthetase beta chain